MTRRQATVTSTMLLGLTVAAAALAQDWEIDWWSIDGGGELMMTGGTWTLSGTIGQWDSGALPGPRGGAWEITSGFWAVRAPGSDRLFGDGFES